MTVHLNGEEKAIAAGRDGDGAAMAMRLVAETARLMGAPRLIPVASAHIDGALYHGDSGTLFAERLVEGGARVSVPSTLNVGALDLTGCQRVTRARSRCSSSTAAHSPTAQHPPSGARCPLTSSLCPSRSPRSSCCCAPTLAGAIRD